MDTNTSDWQVLLAHSPRDKRCVVSVFLNIDQSIQANRNQGFLTQFRDLLVPLRNGIQDSAEAEKFNMAERRLFDFLSTYEPRARGLALFYDQAEDFFFRHEMAIPTDDQARWDREFFLRPLAEVDDEFERYGVALVDRANGRIMTLSRGQIEEVARERIDPASVRHIKAVNDQVGSTNIAQRRADEQVKRNLRLVVRDLDRLAKAGTIDHIIIAGASEPVADLQSLMPKRLAMRIIGSVSLAADAPLRDVLDAVVPVTLDHERDSERQAVQEVLNAAAKGRRAVVGLDRTLKQVSLRRVWQLIYAENFHAAGMECPQCGALFATSAPACFYCSAPLIKAPDVVERAIHRAMRDGAGIEVVKNGAAAALRREGGIGAFLKTRTKSAMV